MIEKTGVIGNLDLDLPEKAEHSRRRERLVTAPDPTQLN